jgi:1-deoxy-D-xylulose-5-phosphate synthase
MLSERGIDCGVANARFAKPLDLDLLRQVREAAPLVLTLEEHLVMGGFGSAVLEAFHREGWSAEGLRVHGIPDQFVEHSPAPLQRANFKLDAAGVVETALTLYPELAHLSGSRKGAPRPGGSREIVAETVTW